MTDPRKVFPPANLKMNWFQEPLRDHTDIDDKISFAPSMQPRPVSHRPDRVNPRACRPAG